MSLKAKEIGTKFVSHVLPGMSRALAGLRYSINTLPETSSRTDRNTY